jgi:superfamily I DNA/RNA helicase
MAKASFKPTAQQEAILDAFMDAKPMIVQAGAGTGKTTTLQMLAESTDDIGLYVAFNRSVAQEARGRFPNTVDACTAHALAKRMLEQDDHWRNVIRSKFSASSNDSAKAVYDKIIYPIYPHDDDNYFRLNEALKIVTGVKDRAFLYYTNWGQLVSGTVKKFCQSADPEITEAHFNSSVAARSINKHNSGNVARLLNANQKIVSRTVELARKYWDRIIDPEDTAISFGFDHILKVWQLSNPVLDYDYVLFDEAQDANATLSHVLLAQHAHGTQLVVVGDQNQAIYGFTGSLDAMKKFEEAVPEAVVLPLTESWRFGKPVADAANQVLATKGVPERITGLGTKTLPLIENFRRIDFIDEGVDAVLCRSNTGCLEAAFWVLEKYPNIRLGLSVKLYEMKEFYEAAVAFQNTGKTKYPVMKDFKTFSEFSAAVAEDPEMNAEFGLLMRTAGNAGGVAQALALVARVESLTVRPEEADITITTVHQSKGAEWNNVLLYDDWTSGLYTAEEKNLLYVATTRAKERLYTGGFWPVFRHSVHLTQEQLETLIAKMFHSGGTPSGEMYTAPDDSPTYIITKDSYEKYNGEKGVFELSANRDVASNSWARINDEDIAGIRVHGVDMVHEAVYVPSTSSVLLDESFLTLDRIDLVSRFPDAVERGIAAIAMDALDALRASEADVTLERLASATVLYKGLLRDASGRVGAYIQASDSVESDDRKRTALCAALIDIFEHQNASSDTRTPSEFFVGAGTRASDDEIQLEFRKRLNKELSESDPSLL